jgi:AGZA family xanthine/uracil permease-like MFS transporter
MDTIRRAHDSFNGAVGASTFGRIFRLEGSGHEKEIKNTRFTTEIRAGLTTFFTMAYIIAVNVRFPTPVATLLTIKGLDPF